MPFVVVEVRGHIERNISCSHQLSTRSSLAGASKNRGARDPTKVRWALIINPIMISTPSLQAFNSTFNSVAGDQLNYTAVTVNNPG
jgi:hypothetical protein